MRKMMSEGYIDYDFTEDKTRAGRKITRKIYFAVKEPPKLLPGTSLEHDSWDWVGKHGEINIDKKE